MSQNDQQITGSENIFPQELAEMGKRYVDAMMEAQTGFLNELRQANEEWIASAQSRLTLASDLCAKLMTARSLPEAATACQEWTKHRADLLAEEGRYALTHSQKLLEASTHFLSNGSPKGSA